MKKKYPLEDQALLMALVVAVEAGGTCFIPPYEQSTEENHAKVVCDRAELLFKEVRARIEQEIAE